MLTTRRSTRPELRGEREVGDKCVCVWFVWWSRRVGRRAKACVCVCLCVAVGFDGEWDARSWARVLLLAHMPMRICVCVCVWWWWLGAPMCALWATSRSRHDASENARVVCPSVSRSVSSHVRPCWPRAQAAGLKRACCYKRKLMHVGTVTLRQNSK